MIAHWMLYSLTVGALLCLGAAALEAGCRALRLPTRWCWAAAVALTLGLPLAAWMRPAPVPSEAVAVAGERVEGTARPMRAAGGVGDDVPVVIRDAAGEVVVRGRSGDLDLDAYRDRIDSIEMVKGAAAPTPAGEIRIRLVD
jgi:hypothetical protein